MKRLFTTLAIVCFALSSFAQLTIQQDTVTALWVKDNVGHALNDSIFNNTGATITITWNRVYENLHTGWTGTGICDPTQCYAYDGSSHTFTMAPGAKSTMYVDMKAAYNAADGDNFVTLKLNDGFSDKYATFKFSTWPTQVKDIESNNVVSVYPNPATNFININIIDPKVKAINVVNIIGKKIFHYDIQADTPNPMRIPLDNVAKGIYLLQFADANDRVMGIKRVTKQ